ncbi:hypothetical protein [Terrimonas alba]|uniref:hypothetical protein n=1 Tax=Terrimonas alba TaxID=3349636 RepID=UPI0035F48E99
MKPFFLITSIWLLVVSVTFFTDINGQYPPAQGPAQISASGNGKIREIPLTLVTGMINTMLRDSIIPQLNKDIDASEPPVFKVDASYQLKAGFPYVTQTKFTNKPNQNRVKIHYDLYIKLDISIYPDRQIYQSLDVYFDCMEWYSKEGRMVVSIEAQKPVLSEPSRAEKTLDAFLAFKVIPFVDELISSKLPEKFKQNLRLPAINPECNCLGVIKASLNNTDSWVRWQYNQATSHIPEQSPETNFNNISIRVESIRRLRARNHETNGILYNEKEDISVQVYANHVVKYFDLQDMNEGESRILPQHTISIEKPASSSSLVLIVNIFQVNGWNDTRFVTYYGRQNFGNGIRKIIVQKRFFTKPVRLPGGRMSKPQKVLRDAYEVTVRIVSQPAARL